ncbi:hypothetical protein RVIR1_00570 [Candidatus Rickettsiella viridis]|uniref:Uncharacterized protein n=1 Tax=Candidatus Rickettsiella viridis TaxID=676208 RepID=A0A2Z5USZ2_9COXI|nr:hypothetical protein [Candidatus Rickettsiella viridis]BBB14599.1 hypothetical protein RVIR1_00570 [Candidatus Rickettsiella viridis]
MKLLNSSLRFAGIVVAILLLTACGGGSGGPGGVGGAGTGTTGTGGGPTTAPPGSGGGGGFPNLGNIAGVTLTGDGGLVLNATALQTLGLQAGVLTPQELARLNVTLPNAGVGVRAITKQGQLIAITGPHGKTFAVPGGPSTLPGTGIRLPSLPSGGNVGGTLKNTLGNVLKH